MPGREKRKPGREKRGDKGSAQRRASRSRKRDQAKPLPADATVTFKDRMDEFFTSNPGMSSRIAHHRDFAAYELDELTAIDRLMLDQSRYYLSEDAEEAFRQYLTGQMGQPLFATARSVRNELERARLRHAHRLASDLHRSWTRDDLRRLEPADILDGRTGLLLERNTS